MQMDFNGWISKHRNHIPPTRALEESGLSASIETFSYILTIVLRIKGSAKNPLPRKAPNHCQ